MMSLDKTGRAGRTGLPPRPLLSSGASGLAHKMKTRQAQAQAFGACGDTAAVTGKDRTEPPDPHDQPEVSLSTAQPQERPGGAKVIAGKGSKLMVGGVKAWRPLAQGQPSRVA